MLCCECGVREASIGDMCEPCYDEPIAGDIRTDLWSEDFDTMEAAELEHEEYWAR